MTNTETPNLPPLRRGRPPAYVLGQALAVLEQIARTDDVARAHELATNALTAAADVEPTEGLALGRRAVAAPVATERAAFIEQCRAAVTA